MLVLRHFTDGTLSKVISPAPDTRISWYFYFSRSMFLSSRLRATETFVLCALQHTTASCTAGPSISCPWCHHLVHPFVFCVLLFRPLASASRWVPHCHLFLSFPGTLHIIAQGIAQSLLRIMNQLPIPLSSLPICPSFSSTCSNGWYLRLPEKHPLSLGKRLPSRIFLGDYTNLNLFCSPVPSYLVYAFHTWYSLAYLI